MSRNLIQRLPSRRTLSVLAAIILPLVLLALLPYSLVELISKSSIMLNYQQIGNNAYTPELVFCDTNGNPVNGQLYNSNYLFWAPSYWIYITFGWGHFTFAAVKGIDITWDWVIGRGWQAICAWIVYVIFRRCWALHWKRALGSIPVEAAMTMQYQTTSLTACWTYLRIVLRRRKSSARLRFDTSVLLAASVYVFLAPTWLSAMTGYIAPSTPVIQTGTGLVQISDLQVSDFVIVDGQRVDAIDHMCIFEEAVEDSTKNAAYMYANAVTNYLDAYYDYNADDGLYFIPVDDGHYSGAICYGNITFASSVSDLMNETICQHEKFYQWGFSFMLSMFFLIATIWLVFALYIVWLCTFRSNELADSVFGSLKTAVQVSAAMDRAVGGRSTEISNIALEKEMRDQQVVVSLSEAQTPAADYGSEESEEPLTARISSKPKRDER